MRLLIYSVILSFILTIMLGFLFIPILRRLKFGQSIREEGPQSHMVKAGTPTMGGIIFLIPIVLIPLLFARGSMDFIIVAVLVTLGFGLIGFIDDYIKIVMKRSLGLRAYQKLIGQIGLSVILAIYAYRNHYIGSSLIVPGLGIEWDLGMAYIPVIAFIIVGVVNSVNLTDGLDGLAGGVTLVVAAAFSIIGLFAMEAANNEGLGYIGVNYENLTVFAGVVTGACMGFLKFNFHPAKVFMGDTGSLGLGGAIVTLAVLFRLPLLLPIVGGVYMAETLSVILQVLSFKLTGKRIFRMSPLHHHFELMGMSETRVVLMFIATTVVLCILGLSII